MTDNFYRALEEKYRGSRELIKSRQRVYLPFVTPLLSLYKKASAIDLGCGRGEWLELLQEAGFDGYGVDLDDGMLAACRERGLIADTADAIQTLEALESESQTVVSGFHIAEHISFPRLQKLVQEAFRVLKPAGILILETPNPENIVVATAQFYTDPTHGHPLPPALLSFLSEFYGFTRTKVLRLQESSTLLDGRRLSLCDVLGGVSPDFSIVAQKEAKSQSLALFDQSFKQEYGLTLGKLGEIYSQQVDDHVVSADARATAAEIEVESAVAARRAAETACTAAVEAALQQVEAAGQRAGAAEARATAAEARATAAEARATAAEARATATETRATAAEARATAAEAKATAADAQAQAATEHAAILGAKSEDMNRWLDAMRRSTSWRITAPLRATSITLRWFVHGAWAWLTLKSGARPHRVLRRCQRRLRLIVKIAPARSEWLKVRYMADEVTAAERREAAAPGSGVQNMPTLNENQWVVHPDPVALRAWQQLLGATPRKSP